ncbi:ASCH domain-containing protein (plasmid) [Pseudomonas fulva]|uniref:ASCH domain-containing protein n=2 Tax=Pseudomonas putida group TaxID=136845 RepID=A0A1X0ZMV4_PSEPU|nr:MULTISPECIES: RNA-binding protein [Pseudomonas]EKT4529981.1 ASCH domain-containing protein [Pseudomonas putida]ORL58661.1 RNA-binding protein [Pseudomonas putida]QOD01348.1 ASCH domain-containing protein [Pseudomonas putida]QPH46654.1 ASCH domain-containing protein [Pseudomonas fulva]QPH51819.1 ASCH domain-containing protein [Pseudomonas fulva]
MKIITINLIGTYFHQIKAGTKTFEYRLRTPFWRKRLEGRAYDMIRICWGYPKKGDTDRVLMRPWRGYEEQTIQHEHFGIEPVNVFAIHVAE